MSEANDDLKLPPGMLARYDQAEKEWGNFADSVGHYYHGLRKWGIREEYAVQMAARFGDQIMVLLESSMRTERTKALMDKLSQQTKSTEQ